MVPIVCWFGQMEGQVVERKVQVSVLQGQVAVQLQRLSEWLQELAGCVVYGSRSVLRMTSPSPSSFRVAPK